MLNVDVSFVYWFRIFLPYETLIETSVCVRVYCVVCFVFNFLADFADVRGITNKKTVLEGYGNVQAALLDYTLTCYSSVTVCTHTFEFFRPLIVFSFFYHIIRAM